MALASEQVLETVEVLEMILFKLPTRDLLLSPRVSKYWKDVIENSKKLQEALFMRAVKVPTGQSLMQVHEIWGMLHATPEGDCVKRYRLLKNPLLEPFFGSMDKFTTSDSFMDLLPSAWRYPGATWRKAIITQPPTTTSVLFSTVRSGGALRVPRMSRKSINTETKGTGDLAEWLEWEYKIGGARTKTAEAWVGCEDEILNARRVEIHYLHVLEDNSELEGLKLLLQRPSVEENIG